MKTLSNVILLTSDTPRARSYVDQLNNNKMKFGFVVIVKNSFVKNTFSETNLFTNNVHLETLLKKTHTNYKILETDEVNSLQVFIELKNMKNKIIVFGGPPGVIIKENLLNLGHRFLHIHPGKLPTYKGSTTIYYSLLREKKVYATAIFLEQKIDAGPIIKEMEFDVPDDCTDIDNAYEPYVRGFLLTEVLKNKSILNSPNILQQSKKGVDFFVIHPLLKHLAILSNNK